MSSLAAPPLADPLDHKAFVTSPEALRDYCRDRWPPAAKWTDADMLAHMPACVARPDAEEGVVKAVGFARVQGLSIVPFGAGSGVCGAVVSQARRLVIDLRAMDRIAKFDPDCGMLEVEAGAIAMDVEKWLNERLYTLGHYPQSMPLATMGGLVATRSSGTFSGRYGNIEDLVVGLDVVLASGEIVRTPRTVRSATGPDLKQVFIGSEGALGVITKVAVRIFPLPQVRWFGGYALPSIDAGIEAVRRAYANHVRPAVVRLYDATEATFLYARVDSRETAPLLIVGHEGRSTMVEAERVELESILLEQGGKPLGTRIGNAWERHRFDASWLDTGNAGPARLADAIEVSAFWPSLAPLYHEAMQRITPLCSRAMGHYSHFYSTGGALYIIFFVEGPDRAEALRRYNQVWLEVMEATISHGGSISHHHGIGRARSALLGKELASSGEILTALKRALDPQGVFNPGHLAVEGGQGEQGRPPDPA